MATDQILIEAQRLLALRQSGSYSHTTVVDEETGDINVDCSGLFVYCMRNVAPAELVAIPKLGHVRQVVKGFFDHLKALDPKATAPWKKVYQVTSLRPGDLICWTSRPNTKHPEDTGHMLIVASDPVASTKRKNEYYIDVIDSSASYHANDSRRWLISDDGVHTSPGLYLGLGSGTISLITDEHLEPISYYWKGVDSTYESTTQIKFGRCTPYADSTDGFSDFAPVAFYLHAKDHASEATLSGNTITALVNRAHPGTNNPVVVGTPQYNASGWGGEYETYDFTGANGDKLTIDGLANSFSGDDTPFTILFALQLTEEITAYLFRMYGATAYERVRISTTNAEKLVSARKGDTGTETNSTSVALLPTGAMILGVSFGNNGSAIQHLIKAYTKTQSFRTTQTIDVGASTYNAFDIFANGATNYLTNKCRAIVIFSGRLTETDLDLAMLHLEKNLACAV